MHTHTESVIAHIGQMKADELDRIQDAIDQRRQQLGDRPVSTVEERRSYRNGLLQLEWRSYRREDGGLTERGPYWYFHYREGGKQRTTYIGKTNDPEIKVDELMGGE